tara:strand:- start:174993 stop:175379 length:387 start_codon:yes stop_codon:yes gene_type:complete
MIQVTGRFKKHNNKVILVVDLDKKIFKSIKEHVVNSMFFAYRRIAPLFKGVILSSIGDSLDAKDNQNLEEAEVGIQVKIPERPPKDEIYLLDKGTQWYVCCKHEAEVFTFSIVKETQLIYSRNYSDAG